MTLREFLQVVRLALTTIREHKLRSFLTVLGVIIGTGTIIGVGSIISGLDGAVTRVLRSFGTNSGSNQSGSSHQRIAAATAVKHSRQMVQKPPRQPKLVVRPVGFMTASLKFRDPLVHQHVNNET